MAKDPITEKPVPWTNFHRQYIDGSVDGDLPMTRLSEMFNVNHFIVSQVNPHVVPFLREDEGPGDETENESRTSPGWLHTLTHLAKEEALHRIAVLSDMGVFPTSLTKIASIMNQKYSGDITIYPEIQFSSIPRMLKNPTPEFMLQACASGEKAAWPKLGHIRNHVAIELALDAAVQRTRAKVALNDCYVDTGRLSGVNRLSNSHDSGKRSTGHQRRYSYSHESEPTKRARGNSVCRLTAGIRRSRSVLDFEPSSFSFSHGMTDSSVPFHPATTDNHDDEAIYQNDLATTGDGLPWYVWNRRPSSPSRRRASRGSSPRPSICTGGSNDRHSLRSRRSSSGSLSKQFVHSIDLPSSQGYSWSRPCQLYNKSANRRQADG